ncbi:MAG: putative phage repressor, partial [uncultured Blastococcus sp.]
DPRRQCGRRGPGARSWSRRSLERGAGDRSVDVPHRAARRPAAGPPRPPHVPPGPGGRRPGPVPVPAGTARRQAGPPGGPGGALAGRRQRVRHRRQPVLRAGRRRGTRRGPAVAPAGGTARRTVDL